MAKKDQITLQLHPKQREDAEALIPWVQSTQDRDAIGINITLSHVLRLAIVRGLAQLKREALDGPQTTAAEAAEASKAKDGDIVYTLQTDSKPQDQRFCLPSGTVVDITWRPLKSLPPAFVARVPAIATIDDAIALDERMEETWPMVMINMKEW